MAINKSQVIDWLQKSAALLEENKAYLTELDSAIGDADHGTNIARGFRVVADAAASSEGDLGDLFKSTAMTLMSKVGGASGMLYGNFFLRAAQAAKGKDELSADETVALFEAGVGGIVQRGRAEPGDKTMIDAWSPALDALKSSVGSGAAWSDALDAAVDAARAGMESTTPMQAKKGRASYLGERSVGHQDPGATSTHLIWRALRKASRDS